MACDTAMLQAMLELLVLWRRLKIALASMDTLAASFIQVTTVSSMNYDRV